jgi:hypothetical protein
MRYTNKSYRLQSVVVVASLLGWVAPALAEDAQVPQLIELTGVQPVDVVSSRAISAELVVVDLELLKYLVPGAELRMQLAPGLVSTGVVEWIERSPTGSLTLSGVLADSAFSRFIFVVEGDVAAGIIRIPARMQTYRLIYAAVDGMHVLCEMDVSAFPPEASPASPAAGDANGNKESQAVGDDAPPDGGSRACEEPAPIWDIVIAYTGLARQAMGGNAAIEAECLLAVAAANQAYADSGIDGRMRLVARGEVAYDESGSFGDHLDWITNNGGGIRETYHADFVSMLIDDDQYCGQAWCWAGGSSAYAYSICYWDCAAAKLTLPHEVGHNMGCDHDAANAGGCGGPSWAVGWRWTGDSGTQWRSVMAYQPGDRVGHFSNPDVDFDGQPTGVAIGDPDEAYNAQRIRDVARTVEEFRLTRFDVWVDFAYGGSEEGSFSQPYDTVAEALAAVINGFNAPELPSVRIKTGSSPTPITINQAVTLRACGGPVTIGE